MLSTVARTVVPLLGRFTVTADEAAVLAPGSIVAANHSSLVDPGVVLAAVRRRGVEALAAAADALAAGRVVVIYPEGRLPRRTDAADGPPTPFRTGLARLAATGAPVVPLGQAGARRISSGSTAKQLAGLATAPLRRPGVHVHFGAPLRLDGDVAAATDRAHAAVTAAWRTAAARLPGATWTPTAQ
ncbi:lysophospholipid acyltransferase family protein [Kitasatospora phosalacinea]|uniref:Phospholipid/glycerol acyltransferase domain-containing protein n=1 Tax=Kitasatospora phosalacinea TaxID=2065 RepID=A0A9W6PAA0_9ACTN|nr:1-acyl-sn-glycerol-3-phosphate acyltransferase [Kitasatospora phosalacinea]GLW51995.1 hypothetical protein Kpho01_00060 [Kitasatospora phosalacinea]